MHAYIPVDMLFRASAPRVFCSVFLEISRQPQYPITTGGPVDPLMRVSATRLRRKTREDELLFPVMSDPLMQMEEASENEKD